MPAATEALQRIGFIHAEVSGVDMFLDGPTAMPQDAVHILMAGEKVRPHYATAAPDVTDSVKPPTSEARVLALESLVRMKLTSYRGKDQVHLQDMLEVGLIDADWTSRFSPELAARLQQLIDTPGQ